MQYQKLTSDQKRIRKWRMKRNHIVCQLLEKNPHMTRQEAVRQANRKADGR